MRERLAIAYEEIAPGREAVLRAMGRGAAKSPPDPRVADALDEALGRMAERAASQGVWLEVTSEQFRGIYEGRGENEAASPLAMIFPRSAHLALFAVTVGKAVSREIDRLFERGDFVVGAMLDAAASEAAEHAASRTEKDFRDALQRRARLQPSTCFLRYSPGYCGWHISGQEALFAHLQPEDIGVTLTESFLMEPLKSISGVIVGGPRRIHEFDNDYAFCRQCQTAECRQRIRSLRRAGG